RRDGGEGEGGPLMAPETVPQLLATAGVAPHEMGDVLPAREGGWHAVVARERADALACPLSLRWKGRAWRVEVVDLERLDAPPESVKEAMATVPSLRLDAVASSGFGLSRSKMANHIRAGRVKVNWQVVDSPSHLVKPGDVISIPGRGKVLVG